MIERGEQHLILATPLFRRVLEFGSFGVRCTSLCNIQTGTEYLNTPSPEFALNVNGQTLAGDGDFRCINCQINGEYAELELIGEARVTIILCYELSPFGMSKKIRVRNDSDTELLLESPLAEWLTAIPGCWSDCDCFAGTSDELEPPGFVCDGTTDTVTCVNRKNGEGWIMGNGTPGALNYFMVYPQWNKIACGYSGGRTPFARYLASGQIWTSDSVWLTLFTDRETGRARFRELVRGAMPVPALSGIMYCTWLPFLRNINAPLLEASIDRAAELGFSCFVLDDGWFGAGWEVDRERFPAGLEPIRERVAKRGLKFGLWFNIGTDYGSPYPGTECAVMDAAGRVRRLDGHIVQCPASAHRERVTAKLTELAERFRVDYFKLDFSSIISPYGTLTPGCFSQKHNGHRNGLDSVAAMYEGLYALRKTLKERFPALQIDFSFESFGTSSPNLAALAQTELHHVSNFSGKRPEFQDTATLRQRFLRWARHLPPEKILHGLLFLDEAHAAERLLTSFCGAPLVAGDLREFSPQTMERLHRFTIAYGQAEAAGALTRLDTLSLPNGADGFWRRNAAGEGFACLFNPTAALIRWPVDNGGNWFNVETGSASIEIPPHDCAMYRTVR